MNSPFPLHSLLPESEAPDGVHQGALRASGSADTPSDGQKPSVPTDVDPQETAEWHESFQALIEYHGPERAAFMMESLSHLSANLHVPWKATIGTPYVNTISASEQPAFPGDLAIEEQLAAIMRWNALTMVLRANAAYGELGGHIASYASAADLFEVGFNHFFRGQQHPQAKGGDLVFFQPHSAPGVYARAYLEGRLTEEDLAHYRQEISGPEAGARGLSSYPHPYLMPDFWQFPTGSMGIGPISSIYQARFMHYLSDRGILDCRERKVWGIFGDGEMDEPESMSALTLAAREGLDNLIWVVNCNLQRLDGPVRGNARVIDELEKLFTGAGWNVIKLLWGSDWDGLFARDISGALVRALSNTVDGQMQTFAAKDGRYNREHFFGQAPELARLVEGLSDEQIDQLRRGGHDIVKIYAAYAAAAAHRGQPTVILAHTKKGYGMGPAGQGRMTAHSSKKLDDDDLKAFRDRFALPLTDEQVLERAFYKPEDDSEIMRYLHTKRQGLGGYLPARVTKAAPVPVPPLAQYAGFAVQPQGRELSTTMVFVRMLGSLLRDANLGPRIVPIVADEARTFGMANLFKQVGIYSSVGQKYEPEDIGSILSYREALDGQILEEGISEAGAISSWVAAATSYSVHGTAMLPFYIYYSMFGFQRVGDLIWAAADQRPRGFLIGATSGRTTLAGEGLQHQDGSSHLWATAIPNCRSYDPAFAGELAVIVAHGMQEMMVEQRDVFYYITVMNENYVQPDLPSGVEQDIIRGGYHYAHVPAADGTKEAGLVTLLGSGAILTEVIAAAEELAAQGVASDIYSITSWSELARDGQRWEHAELGVAPVMDELAAYAPVIDGISVTAPASGQDAANANAHADQAATDDVASNADTGVRGTDSGDDGGTQRPFIETLLANSEGPIIAATDYVRLVPESIRAWVPSGRSYTTLGTDGFGRSDTRATLRRYFGVDKVAIVKTALHKLARA